MKIKFSNNNPFISGLRFDHAYAYEKIREKISFNFSTITVLDYGGNDGKMLRLCLKSGLNFKGTCIDANTEAIIYGNSILSENINLELFELINFNQIIKNKKFDIICVVGVLEHVVDQNMLITRLKSGLKSGGQIILSVPGKHFFSWADMGNLKFYFPKLHRFFVENTKGIEFYKKHFILCENGLFGDIEVGKNIHQHFSSSEIRELLNKNGLFVEEIDGYGFFHLILHNAWFFSPNILKNFIKKLMLFDNKYFESAQLVVAARIN
jgi:2-polyprenyl-3-methyl-5-hydroxy-6-metoxy-1,4-benzoquinol methylase